MQPSSTCAWQCFIFTRTHIPEPKRSDQGSLVPSKSQEGPMGRTQFLLICSGRTEKHAWDVVRPQSFLRTRTHHCGIHSFDSLSQQESGLPALSPVFAHTSVPVLHEHQADLHFTSALIVHLVCLNDQKQGSPAVRKEPRCRAEGPLRCLLMTTFNVSSVLVECLQVQVVAGGVLLLQQTNAL